MQDSFRSLEENYLTRLERFLNEDSATEFFSGLDEFDAIDVIIHG